MSARTVALAERRERLIAQAASQRLRLAADVEPWRRPLAIADRGIAAARFVGSLRLWILGTAVAPLALRAVGVGPWFRRGFAIWRILRLLRA